MFNDDDLDHSSCAAMNGVDVDLDRLAAIFNPRRAENDVSRRFVIARMPIRWWSRAQDSIATQRIRRFR